MSNIDVYKLRKYRSKNSRQPNSNTYLKKMQFYEKQVGGLKLMKPKPTNDCPGINSYGKKISACGYGSMKVKKDMELLEFARRSPGPNDVVIEIHYCGVCHSDWHYIVGEWPARFPIIPGHEITGVVVKIGNRVKQFKIDDKVAVGPYVNSCRKCTRCKNGTEQNCENIASWTYNGYERNPGDIEPTGDPTYGGFSNIITVNENYVFRLPDNLPMDAAAPLLCAGATTYYPLKHSGIGPGSRVGIAGIGGLGHIAVKLAKAMGAHVIALTTSKWKVADAKRLGADDAVLVTDKKDMEKYASNLDLIIDTIPKVHDINQYLDLLAFDGILWMVGVFEELSFDMDAIGSMSRSIKSSIICGISDINEMLDLCSKNNIVADIEKIPWSDVNITYDKIIKKTVKYRYVLDITH